MARAVGCRVPPSRRTITLLFDTSSAADLLEAVRATKRITAVFSRPSTHQTIQLKGGDAGVAPVQKGDLKLGQRYCDAFVADVHPLGFPEALVRALVWFDPNQLCAVTFTPKEAFLQTPGPRAGEPLKGRADANAR